MSSVHQRWCPLYTKGGGVFSSWSEHIGRLPVPSPVQPEGRQPIHVSLSHRYFSLTPSPPLSKINRKHFFLNGRTSFSGRFKKARVSQRVSSISKPWKRIKWQLLTDSEKARKTLGEVNPFPQIFQFTNQFSSKPKLFFKNNFIP
uniref:Uncharacterized protein n=1 Tax=Molossus molossus TaxID=27622 RepID=A0A7J8BYJ0_MOLMO|nr:hypothetical protein HJG59_010069 [Molossus molossus]